MKTTPFYRDFDSRKELLSKFYNVPLKFIEYLSQIPSGEERKRECLHRNINPYIFRTMVDYTRYPEARRLLFELINLDETIEGMKVLDFGCLVADYGSYFARHGAIVTLYDRAEILPFLRFRFENEERQCELKSVPSDIPDLVNSKNLIIFGEVLEHLDDPLSVLKACVDAQAKFIFTSCYPYGDDAYFNYSGHSKLAQQQQESCFNLLRENYLEIPFKNNTRLWKSKI